MFNEKSKSKEEIIGFVEDLLKTGMQKKNIEIEEPKIDFKEKWYDLKGKQGDYYEFLKDTSAIANTPGGDGYIIIGFNAKTRQQNNQTFIQDSGLEDESYLQDKINQGIDSPFNIALYEAQLNGVNYSVIHIPPSNHKPHIIPTYFRKKKNEIDPKTQSQNELFIRRGTTCRKPSKYDLENIFRYRFEHIQELDIIVSINVESIRILNFDNTSSSGSCFDATLILENVGFRPVAITEIKLYLRYNGGESSLLNASFKSYWVSDSISPVHKTISDNPIPINPNKIITPRVGFEYEKKPETEATDMRRYLMSKRYELFAEFVISNSKHPIYIKVNLI